MTPWVSPVPEGLTASVRVFAPGGNVPSMASVICERAWKGQGVRVFRWPCGTVAVTSVGSRGDAVLLKDCIEQLLVTYARHGLFRGGLPGDGPMLSDVLRDLNWAAGVG